jgi:hypothetical protein
MRSICIAALIGSPLFSQDAGPTVSFSRPLNNATVSGNVTIVLRVSAPRGVRSVWVNALIPRSIPGGIVVGLHPIASFTAPPYRTVWNSRVVGNGWITLQAGVTDRQGRTSISSIRVRVSNPAPAALPQ